MKNLRRNIVCPFRWINKHTHPILKSSTLVQLIFLTILFLICFKVLQKFFVPNENVLFKQMTSYEYEEKLEDNSQTDRAKKGIYLVGVIFFSGFLVMILTNGVRNSIDKANSGDARYTFKNHILIYGYNETVSGIITNVLNRFGKKTTIVIVVKENVIGIRESLQGFFGKNNDIYVMHSNMIGEKNLMDFYPDLAREIFIIGDEADNTDFQNIACYHSLANMEGFNSWSAYIYLYLWEPTSLTMLRNRRYGKEDSPIFLPESRSRLKIINTDEVWARRIIVDSADRWPDRNINMRKGIRITQDSKYFTHIVIYGLNNVSEILAMIIAKTCHHPNYVTQGIRTKITIIDRHCREKMGILFGKYYDYMDLCHYNVKEYKSGKESIITTHVPKEGYDFLDTEWDFIESDYNDVYLHHVIEDYCLLEKSILTFFICDENSKESIKQALNLPKIIYDKYIPVWVYSRYRYNINDYMRGTRYDNVMTWGMVDEIIVKEEWEEYSAKYLEYYYETYDYMSYEIDENAWEDRVFNERNYGEIMNNWNRLPIDIKQANIESMSAVPSIVGSLSSWTPDTSSISIDPHEAEIFSVVEHTRWCTCRLIDGSRVVSVDMRSQIEAELENRKNLSELDRRQLLKEFSNPSIKPYQLLPASIHKLDLHIIKFYAKIVKTKIKTKL